MDPAMRAAVAGALVQAMYEDIKTWFVSAAGKLPLVGHQAKTRDVAGPRDFRTAALAGELDRGDMVRVLCRPSRFGPYLSNHFVSPIVGSNLGMRLGPPLMAGNPALSVMANAFSHLLPVGLSPQVAPGVEQVTLYPSDTTATGFISVLPMARDLVPTLPALVSSDILPHLDGTVWLRGRAEFVDSAMLVSAGFLAEDYEALRQAGGIWFLDATGEEASAELVSEPNELWGGLYASGHLEIDGELLVDDVVDVMVGQAKAAGYEPQVVPNLAGSQEIGIYARGLRMQLASKSPFFSFHADVDFSAAFGASRAAFDGLVESTLVDLEALCSAKGVGLQNPRDVDFTYTDSATAHTVMRSAVADAIKDPAAMVLRDWHRLRSGDTPAPDSS